MATKRQSEDLDITFPAPPSPKAIVRARERMKMSLAEAAALIYHRARGWRYLESGHRTLHPALWKLWRSEAAKIKRRRQKAAA
jgi:hypothetical protein